MSFSRVVRAAGLFSATVCMMALLASSTGAEEKSPQMVQFEVLAKQYAQLRGVDAKRLGPQQLLAAAEALEGTVRTLADSSAGDPSAKSKAQELLSKIYTFDGKAPEAKAMYGAFLDTIEAWQGKDCAVQVLRREGERLLQSRQYVQAHERLKMLIARYADRPERVHAAYEAGLACLEMRAFKDAANYFRTVIAAGDGNPWTPMAYRDLARVQMLNEPAGTQFKAAMETLQLVIDKYPRTMHAAYARFSMGRVLESAHHDLEALAEYQRVLVEYPGSIPVLWAKDGIKRVKGRLESKQLDGLVGE